MLDPSMAHFRDNAAIIDETTKGSMVNYIHKDPPRPFSREELILLPSGKLT